MLFSCEIQHAPLTFTWNIQLFCVVGACVDAGNTNYERASGERRARDKLFHFKKFLYFFAQAEIGK